MGCRLLFDELKSFKGSVWVSWGAVMMFYSSCTPINMFTSDMLQTKFNIASVRAGQLQGGINLIAGMFLPLIGLFVDRYGHLTLCMALAGVLNFIANFIWVVLPNDCATSVNNCTSLVALPATLMGLSYGIFAGTAWNSLVY